MRVTIEGDPFAHHDKGKTVWARGTWPARWISCPEAREAPFVVAFRRSFRLPTEAVVRVHVSADERYQLFLDGTLIGRGPERGDADHWFFETYELALRAGRHTLVARVWSVGPGDPTAPKGTTVMAPHAQMSVYPGLLVACDDEFLPLLATGVAEWEARVLPGYAFHPAGLAWGSGARVDVDGAAFAWNYHRGDGGGWGPVVARHGAVTAGRMEAGPSHVMLPATLPAMLERYVRPGRVRHLAEIPAGVTNVSGVRVEAATDLVGEREAMQARLANRQPLAFGPHARRRAIIDLENYYCAYPVVVTTGGRGAVVRLSWAESLFETPSAAERRKGDRGAVAGKFFHGVGDVFRPDGGREREFDTLWWSAGRYVELVVETAGEPLELNLILRETRYPLEMDGAFECDDERVAETVPILLRGLQTCAHETFVDCPYYEQLMYVGDARLEALMTYAVSRDDRLARKAVATFEWSRAAGGGMARGLTQSRWPSRVRQVIPPFSLLWVGMVHDHWTWRGDEPFARSMLPGVRAVLEAYLTLRGSDGLVRGPADGWNFVDWATGWRSGVPPAAEAGASSIVNWHLVLALRWARELEDGLGEPELAARCERVGRETAAAIDATFWNPHRGLYADDPERRSFSEHAQCLAILSGALSAERLRAVGDGLLTAEGDTVRTTIYFTHYLFEALRVLADAEQAWAVDPISAFWERLSLWSELKERGFVTPFEEPEPTRSDCHGWGSHPLFHYLATVLGVRPARPGFTAVDVRPHFGPLKVLRGRVPHPAGEVAVDLRRDDETVRGTVTLPEGVTGTFRWGGRESTLAAGRNDIGRVERPGAVGRPPPAGR
jgi:hypothetical protein